MKCLLFLLAFYCSTFAQTRIGCPGATCRVDPAPTHLSSAWTVINRHGEFAQSETECNRAKEVSIKNGVLDIRTEAQAWNCGNFNIDGTQNTAPTSWPYSTGAIQWSTLSFQYGTVTVRAKYPPQATGTWPSHWFLTAACQGLNPYSGDTGVSGCPNAGATGYREIDMIECFSTTWCQFNVFNPSQGIGGNCQATYSVDANWHTWVMQWTSSSIKISMDGVAKNGTGCTSNVAGPLFMIILNQTGGVGGTPNNANLPTELLTDYILVQDVNSKVIFFDDFQDPLPASVLKPISKLARFAGVPFVNVNPASIIGGSILTGSGVIR